MVRGPVRGDACLRQGHNRLLRAEEGTLTAGTISNRSRDEQWTLSQTGNWGAYKLDLNSDLDWSDAGEHQGTRTHNIVNELTKRELDTNATVGFEATTSPSPTTPSATSSTTARTASMFMIRSGD